MLDAISDCLAKQHVDFIRIDGTTRSDLRSKFIDRFQNHKSCQVALLSLKGNYDIILLFILTPHFNFFNSNYIVLKNRNSYTLL